MADRHNYRDSHFSLYDARDFNESISDYKLRDSVFYNKIPSKLKKTFYLSICLVIIGIGLLVAGIIQATSSTSIQDSFALWILAILCLIPGIYYSVQFIRAKRENDVDYRRDILDDIPTL